MMSVLISVELKLFWIRISPYSKEYVVVALEYLL